MYVKLFAIVIWREILHEENFWRMNKLKNYFWFPS